MKISFLGAAGTVTGSRYLLEGGGKRILIDCGLFQGARDLKERNWSPLPAELKSIDAILLTHAHIDHSGYLPVMWKAGYRGPIYCTHGTKDLCSILLPDSGKLQEEEAEYANKKRYSRHHPANPLFTKEDAEKTLSLFESTGFHEEIFIGPIKATFYSAGHILGSSSIALTVENKTIVFSGDIGRPNDLIMKPPEVFKGADYLLVESTYGNRFHSQEDLLDQLANAINRAAERKGVILIPAFAVGRSQSLLYAVRLLKDRRAIPDIPVFLNSPMSINTLGLYCDYQSEHRLNVDECTSMCKTANYVNSVEESKNLNSKTGPMIIISASGMLTGGRILHHLKAFGPDSKNMILLAGFQAAGTRGCALQDGKREITIHGKPVSIGAEVVTIDGFSAHADQSEILSWLGHFEKAPKTTFITHGELSAAQTLKDVIGQRLGWKTHIPSDQETVNLNE